MNRRTLIAYTLVVLVAAGGAVALKSIDENKSITPEEMPVKAPLISAEQATTILPVPRMHDQTTPPTFEAPPARPCPSSSEVYLTLPPRPMNGSSRC